MKYHATYRIEVNREGWSEDEALLAQASEPDAPTRGACTAVVVGSLLYPEDGSYGACFFSLDGRTREPLSDAELWKAWVMLAHQLAQSTTLHHAKAELCDAVFKSVCDAINQHRERP